ncbi:unnamed protein product [Cuscuta epithymum]|uniref:Uncharacterized protein n=1 Tax=Cuscuta epithymum TaxID=186058 RepID=A0AAV0EP23_9ASTE|nr:unnamed protein product [Cuscuta epithymum]
MRAQYHGHKTLDSLINFYGGVTGYMTPPVDVISLNKVGCSRNQHIYNTGNEPESCPFPWARSRENFLQQETYLMLATVFVLLRLLYTLFPYICRFAHFSYMRYNMRIMV